MHISAEIVWLILALVAGGVEMMTGTVFLLVVALALVFGALTAWLGGTFTWQLVVVALITVVGSLWVFKRSKAQEKTDGLAHPDVRRTVEVVNVNEDGSAEVFYRGTIWPAVAQTGHLSPGYWQIHALDGPRLILKPQAES